MTTLEIFFESPISQIWLNVEVKKRSYPHPDVIIQYVCNFFCQQKSDILGKRRFVEFALVRQFCMYMIREKTHLTLRSIGEIFGKHHTSVICAIKRIDGYASYDDELKNYLTLLRNDIVEKNPITDWWDKKRYNRKRSLNYTL